ncbi:MAG TPA: alpha/beta hydrolase [Steroidobacteraceae bacterium]|nr:alpha/beta hydrolase [Steroidobacteraceae bacterium]
MRMLAVTLALLLAAAAATSKQHDTAPADRQETQAHPSRSHSVNEEGFVQIGGIEQWVAVRGDDSAAPVIVVVHGGPGAAWSGMVVPQFAAWEKKFTLVLWDQRGAGRTFGKSGPVGENITIERMAQDGIEVVQYIRQRLHKQRVILMGISWGSVVAVHMAKARPDLFDAYVGVGQVVNWHRNEAVAYQQLLSRARRAGDQTAVQSLEKIGPPPYSSLRSTGIRSNLAAHFEPGAPDGPELMKMPFSAPGYTKADAQNWLEGLDSSQEHFFGAKMDGPFTNEDLTALGRDFSIPIFILQGTQDDIAPASLAKAYAASLRAPNVAFVPIEGAGHYAFMTRSAVVLQELVTRVRPLASAD